MGRFRFDAIGVDLDQMGRLRFDGAGVDLEDFWDLLHQMIEDLTKWENLNSTP